MKKLRHQRQTTRGAATTGRKEARGTCRREADIIKHAEENVAEQENTAEEENEELAEREDVEELVDTNYIY